MEPDATAPLYRRKVQSVGELISLLRLYFGGKTFLDDVSIETPESEGVGDDLSAGDEDVAISSAKRSIVEVLSAEEQFSSRQFRQRTETWKPWGPQRHFDSYTQVCDETGETMFWPTEEIRCNGLMRIVPVGAGVSSIFRCGVDIHRFLLPHLTPCVQDLKRAIERSSLATGVRVDLSSAKTIEDLVKISADMDCETLYCDPFWYSEITLDPTANITGLDGNFHELVKARMYHTVECLREKNTARLTHAAMAGNSDVVADLYRKIARDSDTLYGAGEVDGVPLSYHKLHSELERLMDIMKDEHATGASALARKYFRYRRSATSTMTPFAHGIARLITGEINCLRLIGQQVCSCYAMFCLRKLDD